MRRALMILLFAAGCGGTIETTTQPLKVAPIDGLPAYDGGRVFASVAQQQTRSRALRPKYRLRQRVRCRLSARRRALRQSVLCLTARKTLVQQVRVGM